MAAGQPLLFSCSLQTSAHLSAHHASHSTQAEGANSTWGGPPISAAPTNLYAKTPGVVHGFVFESARPRPTPVAFASLVPQDEGFHNSQYIKVENHFSKKVKLGRIHDCTVVVGRDAFLVSAYWEGGDSPNRAVGEVCPGLEWYGELAVVQVGRFVTYYKRVKNPSAINKAVSK